MTAKDVLKLAKEKGAKIIDLRFIDLPGLWQHFSIPVSELNEDIFEEGLGFDGSSIRGFQTIDESDMLLVPDPSSAAMDPFTAVPTLVLICNVKDPVTGKWYSRDPRYIAQKAEAHLKKTGLADTIYIGPELEFFFFDSIRFDQSYNYGFYFIDSEAGFWNSGKEGTPEQPNLGYKPRYKQGYFPVPPMDKFQDIRSDMVLALESVGVRIEVHHHEVATGGQTEVDMRYDTLTKMADKVMWYKYCAKNTARKWGKTATFMPKPLFQDNGSGMHTHQSLWKNGKNLFFAACRMAGLDGVPNKIDPGKPVDKDLYELPPAEAKKIKQLPGDLSIVLDNLEQSHDWLLKGDVFTPDVIETWIEYKRKNEVDAVRLRPHPWEFALYFDI